MITKLNWSRWNVRRAGFLAVLAGTVLLMEKPAQAQPVFDAAARSATYGVYVEGGPAIGGDSTATAVLGFTWNFGTVHALWGGAVTTYSDLFVSEWRARRVLDGNRINYTQIGAIASARYRFNEGRSPWFADVGLGVTTMDRKYQTPEHMFSTRFQFTPVVSAGRNFGAHGAHELSLRLQHFSNGGISEPNPGENFVRLRYLYRF